MLETSTGYKRHRFPARLIAHAVWLYHLFGLSLRDIELILAERGLMVSHEIIRRWCIRFGAEFASEWTRMPDRDREVAHEWQAARHAIRPR